MRQRAAVARVLANNPTVLLMDEPFAAVDAMTRQRLQEELTVITTLERTTVVFITHAIEEAVFLSDRVVALSGRPGHVVADIRIELPRPRSWESVVHDADFIRYRDELMHSIHPRRHCAQGAARMSAAEIPRARCKATRSPGIRSWLAEIVPFVVGLLFWQVLSWLDIWPRVLFPSPYEVARAFAADLASGVLLINLAVSLKSLVIPLAVGARDRRAAWLSDGAQSCRARVLRSAGQFAAGDSGPGLDSLRHPVVRPWPGRGDFHHRDVGVLSGASTIS